METEKSPDLQLTSWGTGRTDGLSSSPVQRQKKINVPARRQSERVNSTLFRLLFYLALQCIGEHSPTLGKTVLLYSVY